MASASNPFSTLAPRVDDEKPLLHTALQQLPYGIALFDASLRVTFMNAALESALRDEEKPREASFGHLFTILRFLDPETSLPVAREDMPVPRALAGETVPPREFLVQRVRSGGSLWIECGASPLRDATGLVTGAMMTIRDITEARKKELALKSAGQIRDFIYHGNLAGIIHSTIDGRILDCNDAAVRMFRFASKQEMLGRRAQQLYYDAADRDRLLRLLSEPKQLNEFEVRCRRADGSELWTILNVRMLDARPGEVDGSVVSILLDISERKRHEDILRESEERFSAFMQHLPGIAFIKDLNGRYVYYNESSERIFSKRASEIIGKTDEEIWAPEIAGKYRENDRAVIDTERHAEFVEPAEHPDGKHSWLIYKFPISRGGHIEFVGGIGIDITERELLTEQLNDARKMEALGRLAGGIAHDFNNQLMVISGYGQLALEGVGHTTPEKMSSYLQQILESARKASGLTGQLLAFSRKQVVQEKVVDVSGLLRNMQMLLQRVIGEQIDLTVRTGPVSCFIRADANHMEQVIMNLAVNARDAMPLGGTLQIGCSRLDEPLIRERGPELRILLEVRDTGIGMEDSIKAQIFEPFFTRKETGRGTGLGLSTVYGIVSQAGGHIEVESHLGEGTTFRIYFPEAEADAQRAAPPARELLSAGEESETVLLVEDEPAVRSLAAAFLTRLGYRVLAAESGAAALDIWKRNGAEINVVLTDVIMPQMSGAELAQRLRAMKPHLPVLFMSGYTDDMIARHGVSAAEIPILEKPFTCESLGAKLRDVLRTK